MGVSDSGQAGAFEIEITPAMLEAGVSALAESGALDYQCFATPGLIREIVISTLTASGKYVMAGNR